MKEKVKRIADKLVFSAKKKRSASGEIDGEQAYIGLREKEADESYVYVSIGGVDKLEYFDSYDEAKRFYATFIDEYSLTED